jgi:Fur family transcriptional regulator, peroxide stress response regulator
MNTVQHKLRAKGMRVSHQRVKIMDFLRTCKGHPSARQVYESLIQEMPSLSRTTIYNTLNALAEKGLIGVVRSPSGETRYEYTDHSHCHFFCTSCNTMIDTEFRCRHLHAVESQGHKVQSVQGCFYGVCKECLSTATGGGLMT